MPFLEYTLYVDREAVEMSGNFTISVSDVEIENIRRKEKSAACLLHIVMTWND